jgi:hypothetical protein
MPVELIVGAAVGAAVASEKVRKAVRKGLVYGLAGGLIAFDSVTAVASGVVRGTRQGVARATNRGPQAETDPTKTDSPATAAAPENPLPSEAAAT